MDQHLLLLINREWTSPGLDLFMAAMSSFALWRLPVTIAVVATAYFGGFKQRALLLVIALTLGIGNGLVCDPIKNSVGRQRPREMQAGVRRVELQNIKPVERALFHGAEVTLSSAGPARAAGHSFPSAHAFNNFCVAMLLTLFFRRRGWLYFIPAAMVAYSRVYVGAHWPTDVAAGALLGVAVALLMAALLEKIWRTHGARFAPKLRAAHPGLYSTAP